MKKSNWKVIDGTFEVSKIIEYKIDQLFYPDSQSTALFWIGRIKDDYSALYISFELVKSAQTLTDIQTYRQTEGTYYA